MGRFIAWKRIARSPEDAEHREESANRHFEQKLFHDSCLPVGWTAFSRVRTVQHLPQPGKLEESFVSQVASYPVSIPTHPDTVPTSCVRTGEYFNHASNVVNRSNSEPVMISTNISNS